MKSTRPNLHQSEQNYKNLNYLYKLQVTICITAHLTNMHITMSSSSPFVVFAGLRNLIDVTSAVYLFEYAVTKIGRK